MPQRAFAESLMRFHRGSHAKMCCSILDSDLNSYCITVTAGNVIVKMTMTGIMSHSGQWAFQVVFSRRLNGQVLSLCLEINENFKKTAARYKSPMSVPKHTSGSAGGLSRLRSSRKQSTPLQLGIVGMINDSNVS